MFFSIMNSRVSIVKSISLDLDLFQDIVSLSEQKGWSLSKTYRVLLHYGFKIFQSEMEALIVEKVDQDDL